VPGSHPLPDVGSACRFPRRFAPQSSSNDSSGGGLCLEESSPAPLVGSDDRRSVTDTRRAPFRWICKLISIYPPDSNGEPPATEGTGFLIDPDTIATSGHNIDNELNGIPDFVVVIPGLNMRTPFDSSKFSSATAPFGAFIIPRRTGSVSNFFVSPEWRSDRTGQHDYGLIRFRKSVQLLSSLNTDNISDGWNTVTKELADVSVANVERQKRAQARPEEILRLLRLHSGQIAITGYSGDRPCRQLGMRGGHVRRFFLEIPSTFERQRDSDSSSHVLMESFLDATAGNSGSPYWIMKDRTVHGRRRQQHILVGIHGSGQYPLRKLFPSSTMRVASEMVVITPTVWQRLTDRSLLQAL
jgi:V8-like Glu-specific endopeptidase